MLTKVKLRNFRGFRDHELSIGQLTLIVGRNNAGKSTIIDALRLIELVTARYQTVGYADPPEHLDLPDSYRGISPSLRDLDFDQSNLFYRYGDPPAIVEAEFDREGSIHLYLSGDGELFVVTKNSRGQVVAHQSQAKTLSIPRINILPHVGPVATTETILTENYIRRAISSPRASSNFRNQLYLFNDKFALFKELSERSWPRLQIRELLSSCGEHQNELELHVRDEDFVGEVRWMGHGLQIWLQTMWFLARTDPNDIIILDEPDVYLHADLQRKLIRILKGLKHQAIIATHSIEMISEVDPSSILIADRRRSTSQFATSLPGVQNVIDHIGGIHNVQLTRLWSSRKLIFVEGDDLSILKIFQDILFPASGEPFDILPHLELQGWRGWSYAVGSSMLLKTGGGESIHKYCIFDRDYHTDADIRERHESATAHRIDLHIWGKKEIENYTVSASSLDRHINTNKRKGRQVTQENVAEELDRICESLKDEVMDLIAEEFIRRTRPRNAARDGNNYAREQLAGRWTSLSGKLGVVGGKRLVSRISEWTQSVYGIGVNPGALARSMDASEIDPEMRSIITAIEECTAFRS
jgi:energy-coupling factor transporter ATP-binding protein EcfA2